MFKRFLINLVLASIMFFMLIYARYAGDYSTLHVLNSFFVVGIIMFSFGLLTVSNAGQVFRGFGFLTRKLFLYNKYKTTTYFEYVKNKEEENKGKEKPTGFPALFVGIIFLGVSIIFSVIEYL